NLLKGFDGDVAVVFGDTPLIQPSDFALVREAMGREAAIGVLGFRPTDPARFGRLVMGRDGQLERIVEFKDATAEELKNDFCNSGIMIIDGRHLLDLLDRVENNNAQKEYYLTSIIELARRAGLKVVATE